MSESELQNAKTWSLKQLEFLLSHIESFVENDEMDLRQRVRTFQPQMGLENIESLVLTDPQDPRTPVGTLQGLAPFIEAGLLLQRSPGPDATNWWLTDIAWRGVLFHLDLQDQVQANGLVPEITPLQIHRAPSRKVLESLKLPFLTSSEDAAAYLLRPVPGQAYILISNLPDLWAQDHLKHAHKLINKSFIY